MGDADHLSDVAAVEHELRDLGLEPILVGGMALVILGSRRVTRDFDFVVSKRTDLLEPMLDVFYSHGLELVSRLTKEGDVKATITSRRVASIRLRLDTPASAYFFNPNTRLRIDVLFDFPIPAATLARHATRIKVRSHLFHVASEDDLLRLKKIARSARLAPGDSEDIAFLEHRRSSR